MDIEKLNLAIFISGRGSNMEALIAACERPDFPARIRLVLSNNPGAPGLDKARAAGLSTEVVDHKAYDSREAFEAAILERLSKYTVDLICLAGFMRILSSSFLRGWDKDIINIHPSLLPLYKGVDTHARALADGAVESGCTVHHVIPEMDSGEIIVQKRVPVLSGDTTDTLAERVLEQEHIAYPEAIRLLAARRKNG